MLYNKHVDTNQQIQSLKDEIEFLKTKNKQKTEFLSMVAHQLRTPLAGIKWTLQLLLDDKNSNLSAENRSFIEKALGSNERMLRLLREVIVANQNESWQFSYHFAPLNLHHLTEQMISEFSQEARAHKVHLSFQPETNTQDILVRADKDKIILVLENLFENAIKYNEPYGTVTISLSSYSDQKENTEHEFIKFSIHNTGLSVPIEEQARLFTKFFRASNARKKIQTGTGLGLFTSKQIIEQHKGGIWFHSDPNKGTTFYFTIPVVPQQVGSLSTSHHLHPDIQYKT